MGGDRIGIVAAILDSHVARVGTELIARTGDPRRDAELLDACPSVVLCHDGSDDPRFIYANEAAARRWATTVDALIGMPSRLSAAPGHRGERASMLGQAREHGVLRGYRGERVALDGTSFEIIDAVLWTVDGLPGALGQSGHVGQAAAFASSVDLPPIDDAG